MLNRQIYRGLSTLSLLLLASSPVLAAVDKAVVDKITATLGAATGLRVTSVTETSMPGVYEVQNANGPIVYTNETGDYFIAGDLHAVRGTTFVNLSEQRRDNLRREQLENLDPADMIVFAPEGESKATVMVFTDITCGYCQKLHREVPEMNKRGIEVRYLAFPRGGLDSESHRLLATAWCADDKQDTLTRLKNRERVAENVCDKNPVADQYQLGVELGIRGTPAIVLQSGKLIPGYQSAEDLASSLGLNVIR